MHLPSPQFSRVVTLLAIDLADPSLDSMIRAWDHIATHHLRRLNVQPGEAARIESVRLLSIHDALISIFGPGEGFVFRESSTGTTLAAALAATAQASHDVLINADRGYGFLQELGHSLEESLSLINDPFESSVGQATGAASASALLKAFGTRSGIHPLASEDRSFGRHRNPAELAGYGWKRSA